MDYTFIGLAIWLAICMVDLRSHNKKVEDMYPDHSDPRQSDKRRELTISLYGFYIELIALIILSIVTIVRRFLLKE